MLELNDRLQALLMFDDLTVKETYRQFAIAVRETIGEQCAGHHDNAEFDEILISSCLCIREHHEQLLADIESRGYFNLCLEAFAEQNLIAWPLFSMKLLAEFNEYDKKH